MTSFFYPVAAVAAREAIRRASVLLQNCHETMAQSDPVGSRKYPLPELRKLIADLESIIARLRELEVESTS